MQLQGLVTTATGTWSYEINRARKQEALIDFFSNFTRTIERDMT